jgi:hypothetical protein
MSGSVEVSSASALSSLISSSRIVVLNCAFNTNAHALALALAATVLVKDVRYKDVRYKEC